MTRIACCQLEVVPEDRAGNAARATGAVRAALTAGAELVVLPETVLSGQPFASVAEAEATGMTLEDPLFAEWTALVAEHDAVLVVGFAETSEDGLFNSSALLDSTGVRGVYRKLHLWDEEKRYFAVGSEFPPVLDTAVGRVGLLICYDLEFPELTRAMALAGAEILAVPTAWPVVPHPEGQPTFEVIVAQAAARVNRMAVATCDRSGTTRGQEWTAGTVIIGPDGWAVGRPAENDITWADVDLTTTRDKTLTPRAHLFRDRRPEFYAAVTAVPAGDDQGSDVGAEALP